ncbi:uncharacterized protein ACA1_256130, partial [Acanthamoeba castellanii str. Neff]
MAPCSWPCPTSPRPTRSCRSAVGDVFNFSAGNGFVYNIRSINVFPLSAGRKRAAGETVHVNGS